MMRYLKHQSCRRGERTPLGSRTEVTRKEMIPSRGDRGPKAYDGIAFNKLERKIKWELAPKLQPIQDGKTYNNALQENVRGV